MARLDEQRLIEHDVRRSSCFGHVERAWPTTSLTPSTTAIVLVSPPCFSTGRYTDGWPSTRTMLFWIWLASSAWPTSRDA